ncbi:MAG: DsbA family protein [Pseudomonadales bacterium]|nr:DsbA family protein [Pseudomonadales bacterium]
MEKLRQEPDVTISWAFFPLHPETPNEGRQLKDLFRGREGQVKAFQRRIKQVAEAEGLPYGDRKMTYNSRLSQELGSWANTQADGELLHDALYRAYFVDNQDISNTDVLLNIVQQVGLDVAQARIVLEQRSFAKQVDTDWQRARSIGITGVPTFVSADLQVVGCQSYDVLQKFLKHLRKLKAEAAPEA